VVEAGTVVSMGGVVMRVLRRPSSSVDARKGDGGVVMVKGTTFEPVLSSLDSSSRVSICSRAIVLRHEPVEGSVVGVPRKVTLMQLSLFAVEWVGGGVDDGVKRATVRFVNLDVGLTLPSAAVSSSGRMMPDSGRLDACNIV
jgi:hypothetical protein